MYKTPAQREAERLKAEKATGMKGAVDAVQSGSVDEFPPLGGVVAKVKTNNMNYALRASEWAVQKAEMEVREKEEAQRKKWEEAQQKRREFEDAQVRKFAFGTRDRLTQPEVKKPAYTNLWVKAYEANKGDDWVTVDNSAKTAARLKRREEEKIERDMIINERLENGEHIDDILRDLDGDNESGNSMEAEEQLDEHLKYSNQGM